jgi:hypothetical protein
MNFTEAKETAYRNKTLIGKKIDDEFGTIYYVIPVPVENNSIALFIENFLSTENIDISAKPYLNNQFEVIVLPNKNSINTQGILFWLSLEEALNRLNKK